MKYFFTLLSVILFTNYIYSQDSLKTELPKQIKFVRDSASRQPMVIMFENEYSCPEDIEPFLKLSKNEKALTTFSKYKNNNNAIGGFAMLTIMSGSAALGQLGQGYKRLGIYSGIAVVSAITATIINKSRVRHLKKAIRLYNEGMK